VAEAVRRSGRLLGALAASVIAWAPRGLLPQRTYLLHMSVANSPPECVAIVSRTELLLVLLGDPCPACEEGLPRLNEIAGAAACAVAVALAFGVVLALLAAAYPARIALGTDFLQAGYLAFISLRVHFQDRDCDRFLVGISIHADNFAAAIVNLVLVTVSRIRDFTLEETLLDGGEHAAQVLYAPEVFVCLCFDPVCLGFNEE